MLITMAYQSLTKAATVKSQKIKTKTIYITIP